MKKFLNLKQNIIESKNEPTILQTYLDSIRSSCYKLEAPNSSYCSVSHNNTQPSKQNICLPLTNFCKLGQNEDDTNKTIISISNSCPSQENKKQSQQQQILKDILAKLSFLDTKNQYAQSISLIRNIMKGITTNHTKQDICIDKICQEQKQVQSQHENSISTQLSIIQENSAQQSKLSCFKPQFQNQQSILTEHVSYENCDQLSCILEQNQEDNISQNLHKLCIIPEQTIEFRKILYILDCTTEKKQKRTSSEMRPSVKKLFFDSKQNQNQNGNQVISKNNLNQTECSISSKHVKTDSNCDFGRAIQKGTKCYTTSNFTKNIDNGLKKSSANTKYSGKNAKNHKL